MHPSENQEISGWKGIASYLGVSVPTARKWARELGLPVIARGRRYFADRTQLDRWRAGNPKVDLHPSEATPAARYRGSRLRKPTLFILAACAAALAVAPWILQLVLRATEPKPAEAAWQGDRVVVRDAGQEILWSHRFPAVRPNRPPLVRDVDRDGIAEVIVPLTPVPGPPATGAVVCLDAAGRPLWSVTLGEELSVGDRFFTPSYWVQILAWLDTPGGSYLLVAARHWRWYPIQVLLLDPATGATVSEYWHPGYLITWTVGDLDHDGRSELYLGGVNNPGDGPGMPAVVALDLPFQRPDEASGENFFTPLNAVERHYALLPRPDTSAAHRPIVSAVEVTLLEERGQLEVNVGNDSAALIYTLDSRLRVLEVRSSDSFRVEHDRQAVRGELDHRFEPAELSALAFSLPFATAPDGNVILRRLLAEAPERQETASDAKK